MRSHSTAEQDSARLFSNARNLARQYAFSDYRIDFFPTETGDSAICLRYGTPTFQRTLVYDAGTTATGNAIVDHIRNQYGTNTVHDLICSHPGTDSIAGAFPILDGLKVERLWMHRPWLHSRRIASYFASGFDFDPVIWKHYQDAFAMSLALEEVAFERNVLVTEPFQGELIGPMVVMSPHRDWYRHRLILDFENPPPVKRCISHDLARLLRMPGLAHSERDERVRQDSLENESLTEWGEVTAEMESSVVLYGVIGGEGIVLTGNAGIKALSNAAAFAERERLFVSSTLKFFQVPNKGDANHLSPSVLDRIVGPKLLPAESRPSVSAFVSTSPKYGGMSYEAVTNALSRRGVSAFQPMCDANTLCSFPFEESGALKEIIPTWGKAS